MHVEVLGIVQDMDFKDGSVTNFVVFKLPSGGVLRAVVTDDGARQVVEARLAAGGLPAPAPVHSPQVSPPPDPSTFSESALMDADEDGAVVFGGSDNETPAQVWVGPAETTAEPQTQEPPAPHPYAHNDPAVQQKLFQQHQKELKERAKRGPSPSRTVQKDDMGYPVVRGARGSVDTRDIVGATNGVVDDEGVGQF